MIGGYSLIGHNMNSDFPEELFINKSPIYPYKITKGESVCKSKKILFTGIVRNAEKALERNIQCMQRTGSMFNDYHIFIYENDSNDATVDILKNYAGSKFDYISENREDKDYKEKIDSGEDPWHFNRCKVLAECRNKYLDYARTTNFNYDYICVIDLDVKGGWSYQGFKHAIFNLNHDPKCGCVSSYGVLADKYDELTLEQVPRIEYVMYDSFAFRPLNWNLGIHLISTPVFNSVNFRPSSDPVEVDSNFGGLAIYKKESILPYNYGTKEWDFGYVDPDHVILHRTMKENGWKIILDPNLVVSYAHHKYSIGEKSDKHCLTN